MSNVTFTLDQVKALIASGITPSGQTAHASSAPEVTANGRRKRGSAPTVTAAPEVPAIEYHVPKTIAKTAKDLAATVKAMAEIASASKNKAVKAKGVDVLANLSKRDDQKSWELSDITSVLRQAYHLFLISDKHIDFDGDADLLKTTKLIASWQLANKDAGTAKKAKRIVDACTTLISEEHVLNGTELKSPVLAAYRLMVP